MECYAADRLNTTDGDGGESASDILGTDEAYSVDTEA